MSRLVPVALRACLFRSRVLGYGDLPPALLTAVWPEAARAMLMYRFHTLPGGACEGGAHGMEGRAVCLGIRRHGRGDDAGRVMGSDGALSTF